MITFATSAYDAPERLGGVLATPAADVYSLGVLVHHLLGGSAPPPDAALTTLPTARPPASSAGRPTPIRAGGTSSVDELVSELRDAARRRRRPDQRCSCRPATPTAASQAFEQADAADFFGRDRDIGEMLAVLERERLLVVVGPSGIGKSSVVKAGLVPALAGGAIAGSESWLVTEMVPGREPFEQLAAALERVASVALPDVVGELRSSTGGAGRRRPSARPQRHRRARRRRPARGAVHPDGRRRRPA